MNISTITKVSAVFLSVATVATTALPSFAWGWGADHPRRAEVLHRDGNIGREIARDPMLSYGQKAHLEHEDRAIRNQEQREAMFQGGHISRGQQVQLNREENHLQHQVARDSW